MEVVYANKTVVKQPLFYKVLYILIHTLCTVVESVYDVIRFYYKRILYFIYEYSNKSSKNPFQSVLRPKKIPNHLTVILGDEPPSIQDLANVVIWSLFTGIPFISFYDHKGDFKKKEDSFREIVSKTMKDGDHVIWYDSKLSAYKNGFVGRKIHVKIFTPNDGKPLIARAAKELVDLKKDINIELVDNIVKRHFEFPDPDLAMYCNKKCTTWGYPPWQLRLTEFVNLGRQPSFTHDVFLKLLYRYSKCEQRLGK